MDAQRFCVYNLTRDSLLGQEVSVVDTAVEPLKKLAEYLGAQAKTGVWLLPYRGIPSVPRMPPFDLVCLDADHRVIQVVEMLSSAGYVQLEADSASALVLKARTLHSSQTRPGDQLMICFPAEMESQLERRSGKESLVPVTRGATSPAERTTSQRCFCFAAAGRTFQAAATRQERWGRFARRQERLSQSPFSALAYCGSP